MTHVRLIREARVTQQRRRSNNNPSTFHSNRKHTISYALNTFLMILTDAQIPGEQEHCRHFRQREKSF